MSRKKFQITENDLTFIHNQLSIPQLMIIGYDAYGNAIFGLRYTDASGNHLDLIPTGQPASGGSVHWVDLNGIAHDTPLSQVSYQGSFDPLHIVSPLTGLPLYSSARVADGLRNVSGLYNNLTDLGAAYGSFGSKFIHTTTPDYQHYTQEKADNPALTNAHSPVTDGKTDNSTEYSNPASNVVDYTPRMISQTVVAGGVTFKKDGANLLHDSNGTAVIDSYERDAAGNLILRDAHGNQVYSLAEGSPTIVNGGRIQDMGGEQDSGAGTYIDHVVVGHNADGSDIVADLEVQNPILVLRNENVVIGDPSVSGLQVLFGQFFDHGLDFIDKPGGDATITVPLSPDDPLYGSIGPNGQPIYSMTISRSVVMNQADAGADGQFGTADDVGADGILGTADDASAKAQYQNFDSPYIDQNQTYGSTDQVTTLLRAWVLNPNYNATWVASAGDPANATDPSHKWIPGAELFDGHTLNDGTSNGTTAYDPTKDATWHLPDGTVTDQTLPTLAELRAGLIATGRADLTWEDINNYRARDSYGQVLDMDGNAANGIQALQTGQAILIDMKPKFDAAHITPPSLMALDSNISGITFDANNPYGMVIHYSNGPDKTLSELINFADNSIIAAPGTTTYAVTNELLLESVGDHYVAGDGRANENFGLTALHHVFHEDHNVQLINMENQIVGQQAADPTQTYAHQWQVAVKATVAGGAGIHVVGGHYEDVLGNYTDAAGNISWDNEKLFQSTKLIVEMEYQHVAIDQYARLVTPDLPEFVTYDSGLNADISLEYGEAAFRFGHSQLRETIDALEKNADGVYDLTGEITHYALAQAFLNPGEFADVGPTAILMGMTRQVANEIDEFVTPALQQGLLGQPLDLATINIARGRDLGLPTLNEARTQLYNAITAERAGDANGTSHSLINVDALKPYTGWADFGAHMIHPDDLVSFIAAYSFDGDMAHAQAVINADGGNTAALMTYSDAAGQPFADAEAALAYAINFMNGGDDGYNRVDLWLGGIAEAHVLGGLLGPTFNAIFEDQMERLMDGDRFYYLYRLDGALPYVTDLNQAIATEQFKDIIERTTDARSLNGDVMFFADSNVDLSASGSPQDHKYGDVVATFAATHGGYGVYSSSGTSTTANGHTVTIEGHQYILDYRPDGGENPDGTAATGYNSHEVITGTDFNDYIKAGNGDDTVYGGKGDDFLNGDTGANHIYGEEGNDTIYGNDVDDFLDGGAGNDTIYAGSSGGLTDIVIGGDGNDHLYGGAGIDNLFGDAGDDYIDAGSDTDLAFGGYGNDEMLGGDGPDELQGNYGDDILSGGSGADVLLGQQGDDIIMVGIGGGATQGDGDEAIGDVGFDIVSFSDSTLPMDYAADLNNQNLTSAPGSNTHYEPFDAILTDIEAIVGTKFNDVAASQITPGTKGLIGDGNENWIVGGSGSDVLTGNGGNDVIVGDSVRLDLLDGTWHKTYDAAGNDVLNQDTTGLLQGVGGGLFGTHFTDLLTSRPNYVLGSDTGTAGTSDTAVFTGRLSEYSLQALDGHGNVVANPHAHWSDVVAVKVTDSLASRTLPDGTVVPGDGTDLVIGVENLAFRDQTISPEAYFDIAPSLDLAYQLTTQTQTIASDDFAGLLTNGYSRGTGWNGSWTETGDSGGASSGQISVDNAASFLNQTLHITGGAPAASFDGATVFRAVNLSGLTTAQLSFDVRESGLTAGQTVKVYFSANGAPPTAADVPLLTIDQNHNATNNNNFANHTYNLPGPFTANATVYVVSSSMNSNSNDVYIDNVTVSNQVQADAFPGNNYSTSYTEQLSPVAIASTPRITDPDDTQVKSAKIVIRDAVAGDRLNVGGLPAGVTATGDGTGTVTLSGWSTFVAYQAALAAITFSNPTNDNPTSADRHIDVTVSDGVKDSAVATTTVHFTPVDDAPVAGADNIITNSGGASISVADWMLLANDTDVDSTPSINGVGSASGLTVTHSNTNHSVTITDTGPQTGGSFHYSLPGLANGPLVSVTNGTGNTLTGSSGADIIIGNGGNNTLNGNDGNDILQGATGNDTLNGGNGQDTLIGGAGRDTLSGGADADTFIFNTTAEAGNNIGTGNTSADLITDFVTYVTNQATHDLLDLSAIDANGNQNGSPAFIWDGQVTNGNHQRGHVGYHTYTAAGNVVHTVIDGNTGNGSTHDFQIDLIGTLTFTLGQDIIL